MRTGYLVAGGVLFLVGFVGTTMVRQSDQMSRSLGSEEIREAERAVVLIVSPTCGACNHPSLIEAWTTIREWHTPTEDVGAYLTGVVTSEIAEDGIEFLRRFGPFHEVLSGGGWGGVGSMRFLFEEFPGQPSVPQVVVLRRRYQASVEGVQITEEVEQRRVGLVEIRAWARELTRMDAIEQG